MSKTPCIPRGMPTTLEQASRLVYKLLDRIAELEDRLNQHSGNSSKPPSSDSPGAPPPARKRPASGKTGAQPGHKRDIAASGIRLMPA